LDISIQNHLNDEDFTYDRKFECGFYINTSNTLTILSCILVILLTIAMLRYIAEIIPFLDQFVRVINNVSLSTIIVQFLAFE
jgi:hypothetical protein